MEKRITDFSNKINQIEKEFKTKKWNNEKLKKYIVELEFVKTKTNTICKMIEIGMIPLLIAFLSFVMTIFNNKILFGLFLVFTFTFIELIVSFYVLHKSNVELTKIDLIIKIAEKSIK